MARVGASSGRVRGAGCDVCRRGDDGAARRVGRPRRRVGRVGGRRLQRALALDSPPEPADVHRGAGRASRPGGALPADLPGPIRRAQVRAQEEWPQPAPRAARRRQGDCAARAEAGPVRESAISEPLGPALQEVAPLDGGKPREVRRGLDDVQRALEQSWLLVAAYLTLPTAEDREDLLWSARTVTEKVKTDQRSRSLEVLCLAFFWRGADE
mmetsp:Transcript_668/g.2187  ORF Transcript_668/g.2187 Transcript_668/m.2187 type:complete len:212 (+) Transcript_668:191-826(+)